MNTELDYSLGDLGNELHNICCQLAATDNEDLAYEIEAIVVKLWRLNAAKGNSNTTNGPSDTPDVGEWKLYLCDPTSGKEGLHEKSTDKIYILDKLQKNFDHGLDVWVIAPDGRKILPESLTTGEDHKVTDPNPPQPCARITSTLDAGAGRFFNVEWLNVSELKEGSILYLNPQLEVARGNSSTNQSHTD